MVSLNSFISTTTLNGAVLPSLLDRVININVSPLLVSSTAQLLFIIGVLAIRQINGIYITPGTQEIKSLHSVEPRLRVLIRG